MTQQLFEVVWPRGEQVIESVHFAKRTDSLNGKTIAYLWDNMFRGDEIYPLVTKALSKKYENINFVDYAEFGNTHDHQAGSVINDIPAKLRQLGVDAVISGIGC